MSADRNAELATADAGATTGDGFDLADEAIREGLAEYAPQDRADLLWLVAHTRNDLDNSRALLCKNLQVVWTTVWKILCGKYEAGIASFLATVRDYRRRVLENAGAGFVETPVTRKIFDALDYALAGDIEGGEMVLISAPTRRGKTACCQEWMRRLKTGSADYVDTPVCLGLRNFLLEILGRTKRNKKRSTDELNEAAYQYFHKRRMLIVDEVFRLLPDKQRGRRPVELEFIRRLHDVLHCPVALISTRAFAEELYTGRHEEYLEQYLGRIADVLYIPEAVSKGEVRAICQAFCAKSRGGGEPSAELLELAHEIANAKGKLGVLFKLLRQAATFARSKGEKLDERHLGAAYARRKGRYQIGEER